MKLIIDINEKTIDAIRHEDFFINLGRSNGKTILCNIINAIANATPLTTDTDLISRKAVLNLINEDWKFERLELPVSMLPSATPLTDCTDAISREDAIQALTHFDDSLKRLHELPSVKPTRPTAKWIRDKFMFVECSCCGYYRDTTDNEGNTIPDNYCPNCGAEMESDSDV